MSVPGSSYIAFHCNWWESWPAASFPHQLQLKTQCVGLEKSRPTTTADKFCKEAAASVIIFRVSLAYLWPQNICQTMEKNGHFRARLWRPRRLNQAMKFKSEREVMTQNLILYWYPSPLNCRRLCSVSFRFLMYLPTFKYYSNIKMVETNLLQTILELFM